MHKAEFFMKKESLRGVSMGLDSTTFSEILNSNTTLDKFSTHQLKFRAQANFNLVEKTPPLGLPPPLIYITSSFQTVYNNKNFVRRFRKLRAILACVSLHNSALCSGLHSALIFVSVF